MGAVCRRRAKKHQTLHIEIAFACSAYDPIRKRKSYMSFDLDP